MPKSPEGMSEQKSEVDFVAVNAGNGPALQSKVLELISSDTQEGFSAESNRVLHQMGETTLYKKIREVAYGKALP